MKPNQSISLYGIIGATLVYAAVALAGEPKPLEVPGADWHAKYGHGLDTLECFFDRDRFAGTCYRAANCQ